jgi:hypothetical protein
VYFVGPILTNNALKLNVLATTRTRARSVWLTVALTGFCMSTSRRHSDLKGYRPVRPRSYSAERLASAIAAAVTVGDDPRTLEMWSRAAGVSVRTLQYLCDSSDVSPASCRDLARLLRLVVMAIFGDAPWDPFTLLNADPRTVRRLISLGRLSATAKPNDPGSFIVGQGLVTSPAILNALHAHLRARARHLASDLRPDPALPETGAIRR